MRKLLILLGASASLCGGVAVNDAATAGHAAKAYVCWTAIGGFTDCDWLPRGYRIPGVKRATCCDVRHDSDRSDFVLTRRRIAALAAQVRAYRHHGARRLGRDPRRVQEAPPPLTRSRSGSEIARPSC